MQVCEMCIDHKLNDYTIYLTLILNNSYLYFPLLTTQCMVEM